MLLLLAVAAIAGIAATVASIPARRLQALQRRWDQAVQTCTLNPGFRLGQILSVIATYPNRGELARISWYGTDTWQEIWFERAWPRDDIWVVVSGENGDGSPGRDPQTFYVARVHDMIAHRD